MPPCRVDVELQPDSGIPRPFTFYYPSTCVRDFLQLRRYPLVEFCEHALAALQEANRRVKEKWGVTCSGCEYVEYKLRQLLTSEEFSTGEARVIGID